MATVVCYLAIPEPQSTGGTGITSIHQTYQSRIGPGETNDDRYEQKRGGVYDRDTMYNIEREREKRERERERDKEKEEGSM